MPRANLAGQTFGRLTVLRYLGYKSGRSQWECRCICGTTKHVDTSCLTGGTTRSCGCWRRETGAKNLHDYTGRKFGRLVVLERDRTKTPGVYWLCECKCGKRKTVRAGNLRNGSVRSCGCLLLKQGREHPLWRGGRVVREDGYVQLRVAKGGRQGYVFEHRLMMEKKLGRALLPTENVHHKNGKRSDNRLANLELWVKVQPCGQRITDLIDFSVHILQQYAPQLLHKRGKR